MSISQRFFYNYFDVVEAGNEFKIGDHKHELTDTQLGRICRLTGGHQRSLSLNRCMRLTDVGFKDMSLLTAIWYLDLSYTKCADVSPLASCKYLKSLNLSGLHLSDYIALSLLPSLEVLSLSFGSISTTVPLSHLTKLRSLNLGFTKVQDISGVEPCTRLEELLLDCTQISSAAEVGRVVQQLPQLRLLGVGNTPCAQEKKALQLALPHGAVLHTLTSSYYWFKAIMDNDAARVRELMTFGYDINARASTEDLGPLMLQTWSQRCSGATIFFDVFHPEEALRPKALHLAIFFSSVDALKLLINAGVIAGPF